MILLRYHGGWVGGDKINWPTQLAPTPTTKHVD